MMKMTMTIGQDSVTPGQPLPPPSFVPSACVSPPTLCFDLSNPTSEYKIYLRSSRLAQYPESVSFSSLPPLRFKKKKNESKAFPRLIWNEWGGNACIYIKIYMNFFGIKQKGSKGTNSLWRWSVLMRLAAARLSFPLLRHMPDMVFCWFIISTSFQLQDLKINRRGARFHKRGGNGQMYSNFGQKSTSLFSHLPRCLSESSLESDLHYHSVTRSPLGSVSLSVWVEI